MKSIEFFDYIKPICSLMERSLIEPFITNVHIYICWIIIDVRMTNRYWSISILFVNKIIIIIITERSIDWSFDWWCTLLISHLWIDHHRQHCRHYHNIENLIIQLSFRVLCYIVVVDNNRTRQTKPMISVYGYIT